jgi:hypothetical protein
MPKVEGITLDLTNVVGCDISALIEAAHAGLKEKKASEENTDPPVRKITVEELQQIINKITHSCNDCSNDIMYSPRKWGSLKLCHSCYKKRLIPLSEEINRYLLQKGMIACNFCNKERKDHSEFHLDHINMFTKTGNVGNMMYTGADIDSIKKEIDKCQLLCISCHAVVTHIEHKYGFIKAKRARKKRNVEHVEKFYDEYMGEVYAFMRGRGGK